MKNIYTFWKSNPYFSPSCFKCPCCGTIFMQSTFMAKLNHACFKSDCNYFIISGYRCKPYNSLVNGSETSSHLYGYACDIAIPDNVIRLKVLFGLLASGFTRIGVYKNYIHVDSDPNKPDCIWLK